MKIDKWFLITLKREYSYFQKGKNYKAGSYFNGRMRLCKIYDENNKYITTISQNAVFYNFERLEEKKV